MKGHSGGAGEQSGYSRVFLILLAVAVMAAIAGLAWSYHLSGRLTHAEAQLSQAQQQNQKLASALDETNARLKITNEALGHSRGSRQKQLEQRARELLRRQRAAAENTEAPQQNNSSVSASDTKTGSGSTQTELKSGEAQLQSVQGDLGLPSGPIATNQDELNFLERRHARNYYPFTLKKGEKQQVSTVTLELRKADLKHNRYTLIVHADNKKIEKKNRGLNEPVQFYTGKDKFLYELVVNSIEKNEVTGYLATPLNAPAPASTSGS